MVQHSQAEFASLDNKTEPQYIHHMGDDIAEIVLAKMELAHGAK